MLRRARRMRADVVARDDGPREAPLKTNSRPVAGIADARVRTNDGEYKRDVAVPILTAVDAMPKIWRELVREFDYVSVYLAWKRGMTPAAVREKAKANGGVFVL